MHGLIQSRSRRRQSRRRRQVRHGRRLAALRAHTGAVLYLEGRVPSIAVAAEVCGSNLHYVRAMVTLLKSENMSLLNHVLAGHDPVLVAAVKMKQLAKLVTAYRDASASADTLAAFGQTVGAATLFDRAVVPAL